MAHLYHQATESSLLVAIKKEMLVTTEILNVQFSYN